MDTFSKGAGQETATQPHCIASAASASCRTGFMGTRSYAQFGGAAVRRQRLCVFSFAMRADGERPRDFRSIRSPEPDGLSRWVLPTPPSHRPPSTSRPSPARDPRYLHARLPPSAPSAPPSLRCRRYYTRHAVTRPSAARRRIGQPRKRGTPSYVGLAGAPLPSVGAVSVKSGPQLQRWLKS